MASQQRHLLVVESEQARGRLFSKTSGAGPEPIKFTIANTLAQARRYLAQVTPDLVLADINLPDGKATHLLPPKGDNPLYPLVIMADYPDEKLAAEAVKTGAIDYIVKSDAVLKNIPFLLKWVLRQWNTVIKCNQTEQKLLDYQRQLKALASRLLLCEENERRRLAIGVHDSIGQNLALAKAVLQSSMKSTTDAGILEALREACASLDEVVADVHSLTFELSNPVLYELGFVAAAQNYLTEKIRDKHGLKCKFAADTQLPELGREISVILYRTIRELLLNVVKHAKAKVVNLYITKAGEKLQVDIEDDGVGFDPAGVDLALTEGSEGGFGLFSIHQQLEHFGGTIKIKSEHGKGTYITVTVPLKNNNTKPESERVSK